MFRVMVVEDEPFNIKGLKVLIDWEREGFEIVYEAANGHEALEYLQKYSVDLILADVKMPVMDGIQLLEILRRDQVTDADYVILSGYAEFQFAQKAISCGCTDYILKPVQSDVLLEILQRIAQKREYASRQEETGVLMKKAWMEQNIAALLRGQYTQENTEFVKQNLRVSEGVRYVHLSLDQLTLAEEITDDELGCRRNRVFENCRTFLGADQDHCIRDFSGYQSEYEIGLIYCEYMAAERGLTTGQFMERLLAAAIQDMDFSVVLLVGKQTDTIEKISKSYGSACMLRSLQGFQTPREIYYYEEELQVKQTGNVLCKENLDMLIKAMELNDKTGISRSVDSLFQELEGLPEDCISLNINYLMFQLVHLAVEQDETINQEEVMRYIGENVLRAGFVRGSKPYLRKFAGEYVEYLTQLRKNVSRGVLKEVEREIREHYADNLTLRDLSKKYFINSSYLGQIFHKKYGQSFKDYLNDYRINEAAARLLKTDKKIGQISEEVGYHDMDYFVSRFITIKGCTPARYRKQNTAL